MGMEVQLGKLNREKLKEYPLGLPGDSVGLYLVGGIEFVKPAVYISGSNDLRAAQCGEEINIRKNDLAHDLLTKTAGGNGPSAYELLELGQLMHAIDRLETGIDAAVDNLFYYEGKNYDLGLAKTTLTAVQFLLGLEINWAEEVAYIYVNV